MRRYNYNLSADDDFSMQIEEVIITDHGTTLIGCIHSGKVFVGDHITLSTVKDPHLQIDLYVSDIGYLNESVNQAEINDWISLSVSGVSQENVQDCFPLGVYVYKGQGNQLIYLKLKQLDLDIWRTLEYCTKISGIDKRYSLSYIGLRLERAEQFKAILNNVYGIGILTSDILSCSSVAQLLDMVVCNPGVSSNSNRGFETEEDRRKTADLVNKEVIKKLAESISNHKASSGVNLEPSEQEYLETLKTIYEEDGEISSRERRLLNRLREKLCISERRARELEDSLNSSQLTSGEQEYLDEYRACLEEGEISSKERRLLDRLRDKLGIHPSRAKELENL